MRILFFCLFSIFLVPAHAILNIEITGDMQGGQPIAIVPFVQVSGAPPSENIAAIITDDLYRTGHFMPIKTFPEFPGNAAQVNFSTWQAAAVPHLVVGEINTVGSGNYTITFYLLDVFGNRQMLAFKYTATSHILRKVAHQISDKIYEALTGQMGAFNTLVAYVGMKRTGPRQAIYHLYVADVDGAAPRDLLTSKEPIFSLSWSPDGQQLAYVSMEGKKTSVYAQNVYTGSRRQIAAYPGLNSAPAWSPDGSRLALSLSKDGNPEIYILNAQGGGGLMRLTSNAAIDTEPTWSPDGQTIVFTSDRSGGPQLYSMSIDGGNLRRLTFEGNYNASAHFSPDGSQLALLHGSGGYRIATLNMNNGQLNILTRTNLDEAPCFAPNGSMIIYGSGSDLAVTSVDGRVKQRLVEGTGEDIREAAWSPLRK